MFFFVIPPLLAISYAYMEHYGLIDKITGRKKAIEAVDRIKSGTGFPESWLFNDERDRKIFAALEKRLSRQTKSEKIRQVLSKGIKPSCIAWHR